MKSLEENIKNYEFIIGESNLVKVNFYTAYEGLDYDDYVSVLKLKNKNTNIYLQDCYAQIKNANCCTFLYETKIEGEDNINISTAHANRIDFVIDTLPTPMLIYLKNSEHSFPELNFKVKIEESLNGSTSKIISIASLKSDTIENFETLFFDILELFFICYGFYPYIKDEIVYIGNKQIKITRLQKTIFMPNKSFAHWSTIIKHDLKLDYTLLPYITLKKKNPIIILMLTEAVHSTNVTANVLLTFLLQAIEGFVRTFKKKEQKKFDECLKKNLLNCIFNSLDNFEIPEKYDINFGDIINSIKGLLGNINTKDFKECFLLAVNTTKSTISIFEQEYKQGLLEKDSQFLKEIANTRNQFSHITAKENTFENIYEIIKIKSKCELLLRVLILEQLGSKVGIVEIKNIVKNIDDNYLKNCQKV